MYTTAENERSRMIEENMGLVHACAHKFKGKGIEYDDLFQAGCMGLVKATDAFDTQRGVRFSTYAVPVISGSAEVSGSPSAMLSTQAVVQRSRRTDCRRTFPETRGRGGSGG